MNVTVNRAVMVGPGDFVVQVEADSLVPGDEIEVLLPLTENPQVPTERVAVVRVRRVYSQLLAGGGGSHTPELRSTSGGVPDYQADAGAVVDEQIDCTSWFEGGRCWYAPVVAGGVDGEVVLEVHCSVGWGA